MGVLGITANFIFAALGMNSWVVPLIDAGMPPNGVCWMNHHVLFLLVLSIPAASMAADVSGEQERLDRQLRLDSMRRLLPAILVLCPHHPAGDILPARSWRKARRCMVEWGDL